MSEIKFSLPLKTSPCHEAKERQHETACKTASLLLGSLLLSVLGCAGEKKEEVEGAGGGGGVYGPKACFRRNLEPICFRQFQENSTAESLPPP